MRKGAKKMEPKQRLQRIRLLQRMEKLEHYSQTLGLTDCSAFRTCRADLPQCPRSPAPAKSPRE